MHGAHSLDVDTQFLGHPETTVKHGHTYRSALQAPKSVGGGHFLLTRQGIQIGVTDLEGPKSSETLHSTVLNVTLPYTYMPKRKMTEARHPINFQLSNVIEQISKWTPQFSHPQIGQSALCNMQSECQDKGSSGFCPSPDQTPHCTMLQS